MSFIHLHFRTHIMTNRLTKTVRQFSRTFGCFQHNVLVSAFERFPYSWMSESESRLVVSSPGLYVLFGWQEKSWILMSNALTTNVNEYLWFTLHHSHVSLHLAVLWLYFLIGRVLCSLQLWNHTLWYPETRLLRPLRMHLWKMENLRIKINSTNALISVMDRSSAIKLEFTRNTITVGMYF